MSDTMKRLASAIDHTLLKPEATPDQIDQLCEQAMEYGFAAVCVNPVYVRRAVEVIRTRRDEYRARPAVASVVGFPLGASHPKILADEVRQAIDDGATEVDMVAPLGLLIDEDYGQVRKYIEAATYAAHQAASPAIVKVILETAALTEQQIIQGCRCCAEAEADFVKTSTGFHPSGGATVEHVALLHRYASPIKVKASGGIRTLSDMQAMLDAGASRIGTSFGVTIMTQAGELGR